MGVKPLVPTVIRTEFGDVLESEAFHAAQGAQGDVTYVPGYSDMRRRRDNDVAIVLRGNKNPDNDPFIEARKQAAIAAIPSLPVRLQWVRTARYSGAPDKRKQQEYGSNRYRTVTEADIGQEWFTELPPNAEVGPGGEIRSQAGDCTLMVTSAENAARNAAAIRIRTDLMTRQETAAAKLMELGAAKPGSDPSIEVKPGETVRIGSSIKAK